MTGVQTCALPICIGGVETYAQMTVKLAPGDTLNRNDLLKRFVEMQYKRNDDAFYRGAFRVRGDVIEVFPSHLEDRAWRLSLFGDELETIWEIDPLTGKKIAGLENIVIYPASHYVTPRPTLQQAIPKIKEELKERINQLEHENKLIEAQRIEERTTFDLEMLETTGHCSGIENYSRYLTGRDRKSVV